LTAGITHKKYQLNGNQFTVGLLWLDRGFTSICLQS